MSVSVKVVVEVGAGTVEVLVNVVVVVAAASITLAMSARSLVAEIETVKERSDRLVYCAADTCRTILWSVWFERQLAVLTRRGRRSDDRRWSNSIDDWRIEAQSVCCCRRRYYARFRCVGCQTAALSKSSRLNSLGILQRSGKEHGYGDLHFERGIEGQLRFAD